MNCPACGRRLLSQASARCNWCGETVPDTEFQAHAGAARAEYFAHMAAHDAASLLALEGFSGPPLFSLPPSQAMPPTQAMPIVQALPVPDEAPPDITTEQDDARERFRHLEL